MGWEMKKINLQTTFIFGLISVLSYIPIMRTHRVFGQGDLLFHLNRMLGLAEGLRHGQLNYRSFDVLSNIGSATNYFYPFVFTLVFAGLFVVLANHLVLAFYVGELILLFCTLMVAYWSMKSFAGNHKRAFIFAILWGFSGYRFYLALDQFVLGEAIAFVFLPLVFLGFYEVFFRNHKRWYLLGFGMTLLLYAHMLSVVLTTAIFVVIALSAMLTKRISGYKERIGALIRAISLFIILGAVVWVPLLYQFSMTKIQTTTKQSVLFMASLGENLVNALNGSYQNIGIFGVVAVVWALVLLFQKRYELNVLFGLIGVIIFILGTNIFPWYAIPFRLQALIQFPYRLFSYATLFLFVFLSKELADRYKQLQHYRLAMVTLMVFSVINFWGHSELLVANRQNNPVLNLKQDRAADSNHQESTFVADTAGLKTILGSRHDYIGMMDYAPINSWQPLNTASLLKQEVLFNHQAVDAKISYQSNQSMYQVTVNQAGWLDLPVLAYGNETVLLDGYQTTIKQSQRGSVAVYLESGQHIIQVSAPAPRWIYGLWIFVFIAWMIVLLRLWSRDKITKVPISAR